MRTRWLLGFALAGMFCGTGTAQQESIKPDLKGAALASALRADHSPAQTLNYDTARDRLFGTVDNRNGATRLLYTPETIAIQAGGGRPNGNVANTEHVWVQSKFQNAQKKSRIKCDLHHLFPSRDEVNGARSNNPFAEIPDDQTTKWWISDHFQTAQPTAGAQRDMFSESTSSKFEPREAHKGDVARAMFYVLVIYGDQNLDQTWFQPQLEALLAWHQQDPADEFEFERSKRIKAIQGNQNPFIQDRTLIYRVLERPVPNAPNDSGGTTSPPTPTPPTPVTAGNKVRIVTWNVREIFSVQNVVSRKVELKAFATAMKPDILFLQEVTSYDEVEKIRDEMGLAGYHVACSNFVEDGQQHGSFEVGIISRFPLEDVTEFDPTPDNDPTEPNMPETEKKLVAPDVPGLVATATTSRGYLRARIEELKLIVRVTHLKSSVGLIGGPDKKNAEKREIVAAAMAADTAKDAIDYPEYTSITLGDMNVGATDAKKLGTKLGEDDYNDTPGADKYDETDALFTGGLVDGLKMTNLAKALGQPTFVSGTVAVGPIDWILVAGKHRDKFDPMDRAPMRFGSDHWGVGTFYTVP